MPHIKNDAALIGRCPISYIVLLFVTIFIIMTVCEDLKTILKDRSDLQFYSELKRINEQDNQ